MQTLNPTPTPTATTRPCPSDQAIPVRLPTPLFELALAQGITPEWVGAYLRSSAGYLTSAYRFARSDLGMVSP